MVTARNLLSIQRSTTVSLPVARTESFSIFSSRLPPNVTRRPKPRGNRKPGVGWSRIRADRGVQQSFTRVGLMEIQWTWLISGHPENCGGPGLEGRLADGNLRPVVGSRAAEAGDTRADLCNRSGSSHL